MERKHVPPPPAPVHERKRPSIPRLKLPVSVDDEEEDQNPDKLKHEEDQEEQSMNRGTTLAKGYGRGKNMGFPVKDFKTMEEMNEQEQRAGLQGWKHTKKEAKEPEP